MQTRTSSTGRTVVVAAAMALAASAGACGSGSHSPPPNCLQVQPCGGDVVGSWSFLGACSDIAAQTAELAMFCPGAAINASGVSLAGALTFNADSTYTASNWHETFVGTETLPLSCVGATSCAQGSATNTDSTATSTTSVTTSCSGASTCFCRVNGTLTLSSESGTFTTSGTFLDMFGDTTSGSFDYCVEDNRLHLISVSDTGVIVSDIVAARMQ